MIQALNMEFETVRTVLKNDVNAVDVCVDVSAGADARYTLVSITSEFVAKDMIKRIAVDGIFAQNGDFIGSFTHKNALYLVFRYYPESLLHHKEALYAPTFANRKEAAVNILAALAETEIPGDLGKLLLTEGNVNLTPDKKAYVNYFLDFTPYEELEKYRGVSGQDLFYRDAALYIADFLCIEYAVKYDQQTAMYPDEVRLMYRKAESRSFRSYSQIILFIKELSDKPKPRRFGIMRIITVFEKLMAFILSNPMNLFIAIVVLVTLIYLGYQLAVRGIAGKKARENTYYAGIETIGEIDLGEEDA